jgi:large subunit ribosomal protein L18
MNYIRTLKRIRRHKTNYRKRELLLISKQNFITIKVSNQNVSAQILKPQIKGDIVITSVHSRELIGYGWRGSLNNIPACFAIGMLLGNKAKEKGIKNAILYIGNDPFTSRIGACLKGIVHAGINVPVSDKSFPDESRLNGKHIADYAQKIKTEAIEKYNRLFSSLLRGGLRPEDYQFHVKEISTKILGKSYFVSKPTKESKNILSKDVRNSEGE